MAGRHRRSSNLKFATRKRRKVPLRLVAFVVVVVVVAAAAILARAATSAVPALTVRRVLPASVRFPGAPPAPAWPKTGQAAVEVEGLGSLGSSGRQTPVPIASVAKVMTAYVILQDHPVAAGQSGFSVTIGSADVADFQKRQAQGELVTPVASGEVLTEVQLLEALLVASGNNIAPILADHDAGSVPAFVAKMNAAAHRLGMDHTTYTDASGIASTTVSTASDQLILAAASMRDPVFARIVAMRSVNLPVAGTLTNFNHAVGADGWVGIKTGSDALAGGCLVFANRQVVDGRTITILGVVLRQDPGQQSTAVLTAASQNAANALVQSVRAAVRSQTVVPAGTPVAVISNAQGRRTTAVTASAVTATGWGGMTEPLGVSFPRPGRSVPAGATVAQVTVPSGQPGQVSATTQSAVPAVSFGWKIRNVF